MQRRYAPTPTRRRLSPLWTTTTHQHTLNHTHPLTFNLHTQRHCPLDSGQETMDHHLHHVATLLATRLDHQTPPTRLLPGSYSGPPNVDSHPHPNFDGRHHDRRHPPTYRESGTHHDRRLPRPTTPTHLSRLRHPLTHRESESDSSTPTCLTSCDSDGNLKTILRDGRIICYDTSSRGLLEPRVHPRKE